jgi:hypothetical protein
VEYVWKETDTSILPMQSPHGLLLLLLLLLVADGEVCRGE